MIKRTIYIETYGCAANQNNSEILAGLLTRAGHIITNNQKLADTIIINSCIVKHKTEHKIKRRIQDLKEFSKQNLLVIAGCMPQTDAKKLKQLNQNIILLGTHNYKGINNLIQDYSKGKLKPQETVGVLGKEYKILLPKIPQNKLISIHQISEGCLGKCTYCKTRLAKGPLHSYPESEILKSIESDLKQGAKEIWLTSQDCAVYGLDNNESGLPRLLKKILALKHRFKLRLGMSNPNHILLILPELIEIYKDPKMFKFLHIPIQSASNKVLKDMNRGYTIQNVEQIIQEFRDSLPNMVIATDIITGYPTENSEDHKANLEFINIYKPDVFNLSKFSRHKGTFAENLKELSIKTIKKRTTELMATHRKTALENKEKFLDKEIKVFIEKKLGDSLYQARDDNYNIVLLNSKNNILAKNINVKINKIGVHHLIGNIISQE